MRVSEGATGAIKKRKERMTKLGMWMILVKNGNPRLDIVGMKAGGGANLQGPVRVGGPGGGGDGFARES